MDKKAEDVVAKELGVEINVEVMEEVEVGVVEVLLVEREGV